MCDYVKMAQIALITNQSASNAVLSYSSILPEGAVPQNSIGDPVLSSESLMSNFSAHRRVSLLLICHSYPPAVIAGSEVEAQRVCEELIKRGHTVKVVCTGGAPMPDTLDWIDPKGVPVRMYARHWSGAIKDAVFALRVGAMLVKERRSYEVVYFLMQGLHLAVGLPIARLLKKPIIMKISSSIIVPILSKSIMGRLELYWLRKWARSVMVLNNEVYRQAIDRGFASEQLLWMPNPVDTDEFSPASVAQREILRSRLGVPPVAPVVLYCGRLATVKDLASLLDAFALVVRELPEAILILLGDGPNRGELTEQARRLRLTENNLRFMGRIPPGEIPLWSQLADVFALVSRSEGFSCALAEAMSTGLPCVVSDIPANRQLIVPEHQGLLTPVGDHISIAHAILRLLRDPELRDRMGREARRTILNNYSIQLVADRYESLMLQAITNGC
jgi:glycosyltransferase involved in cell wall biosynthesis